ncbi:SulP family inorganic anion transporter [Methanobacterium sp. ACI-7]|uniref:SulP family inorganic anion transporter n=1 Tax=unclassified Methanobacterium TaxID=2627676 RepID=UPI0039C1384E
MKEIKDKILNNKFILTAILPLKSNLSTEIFAGAILAAISIPAVMGYAKIAGMPIITGLYTILVPLVLFALFGSSRHLVVGADSATAAILASTLLPLAAAGSPQYIGMVSTVALLCAFFLLLARILKLSLIADFMSRTVLVGFLTGVGIQIAISQLSNMFGLNNGIIESTIPKLIYVFTHLNELNIFTLIISVIVVINVLILKRISPKVPGELIAIIGSIIASFIFNLQNLNISTIGSINGGLPSLFLPSFNITNITGVLIAAGTCFLVIIAQSTATARAYALKYDEEVNGDKDILGLALANTSAGLTGTFIINGSPSRTEVLSNAGGNSQLPSIITAIIVLIVILFFTELISLLPTAVLASIVFLIGIGMININELNHIRHIMRSEYYLAIFTAITVVVFNVLWGIIFAILLSMILHLSHSYTPNNSILIQNKEGKFDYVNLKYGIFTKEGIIIYRFNRDLYYANSDRLHDEAIKLIKKADNPIKWFVLDAGGFESIDYTASEMLKRLHEDLEEKGVKFVLTTVLPHLEERMDNLGLIEIIGSKNIYKNNYKALEAFEKENQF